LPKLLSFIGLVFKPVFSVGVEP